MFVIIPQFVSCSYNLSSSKVKDDKILSMWDDIKMWLYLRLLDSELRGCIPHEGGYGIDKLCEICRNKRFRNKDNFLRKVENFGLRIYLVLLPFSLHKLILKGGNPGVEKEIKISDKTEAIFGSAESLGLIQHPQISFLEENPYRSGFAIEVNKFKKHIREGREYLSLSYSEGNRFVSWSGLISFLYQRHWQFILLLWSIFIYLIYFIGNATGLFIIL